MDKPRPNTPEGIERRKDRRHRTDIRTVLTPVKADGSLDPEGKTHGRILDVSASGLRIQLDRDGVCRDPLLLVSLEPGQAGPVFVGIEVVHELTDGNGADAGAITIGAMFGGVADLVLRETPVLPRFDPNTTSFSYPYPDSMLQNWCHAGLLEPILLDRIQACPRCNGLTTFRLGCRRCMSGRVDDVRMIHHYACAHIAEITEFEKDGTLVCPKCRSRDLVIGTDFEYQTTHRCRDCTWEESSQIQIGHCMLCDHRFSAHEATQNDLVGYRLNVARIDTSNVARLGEEQKRG